VDAEKSFRQPSDPKDRGAVGECRDQAGRVQGMLGGTARTRALRLLDMKIVPKQVEYDASV